LRLENASGGCLKGRVGRVLVVVGTADEGSGHGARVWVHLVENDKQMISDVVELGGGDTVDNGLE